MQEWCPIKLAITLAAIGKIKAGVELELFHHYAARLPWKITVKEKEIKKPLPLQQRREQEGEFLLSACKGADYIIALGEKGKQLGSSEFAQLLEKNAAALGGNIAFIIGGADGLDDAIRHQSNLLLSLGKFTFPHMLVRGLLAEQLYRSHTILTGHPYHRE